MRFPGFEGEWKQITLGECSISLDYGMNAAAKSFDGINKYIRITDIDENSSRYKFENPVSPSGNIDEKYLVGENDILFARTGASTGKSYLYNYDDGKLYFAGFLIRAKIKNEHNSKFIFSQTQTEKYNKWVQLMSMRSGQPGINSQEYSSFKFYLSSIKQEQDKIANFLTLIDERIATQNKIIKELKLLKNTIRYQLYKQILNEENESVLIKDILNYEQPTKYLVTDTDYSSDTSLIPVLTANKAFVLGYTDENFGVYNTDECIIFDDFTMDMKFVNFRFKVKSSAIKILTAKRNVNLKFIFEYLSFLNLSSNEHKRHYISEIEQMEIAFPNHIRQKQIAIALFSIDEKIKIESKICTLMIKQKQYLLESIFI